MGGFSKIHQGSFGEKESTMGMQPPQHPAARSRGSSASANYSQHPKGPQAAVASEQGTKLE